VWHNRHWAHSREWVRWLELQHQNLQLLNGYETDKVEGGTTINEDMVQLDAGNGWRDNQWKLAGSSHALGTIRGIKADSRLHPLVVQHCIGGRSGWIDDAPRCNVPGALEHDVERLIVLIVAGLKVGMTVDGLHLPLGVPKCHVLILVSFGVHLLFALPLTGRRAFLARLLLLLTKLFCELLDLLTLFDVPPLCKDSQFSPGSLQGATTKVMTRNTSHTRIKHMKCSKS
jgi:hypothetical protein